MLQVPLHPSNVQLATCLLQEERIQIQLLTPSSAYVGAELLWITLPHAGLSLQNLCPSKLPPAQRQLDVFVLLVVIKLHVRIRNGHIPL